MARDSEYILTLLKEYGMVTNEQIAEARDKALESEFGEMDIIDAEMPYGADGSITYEGGMVDKCAFPLPMYVNTGDTVTITVKVKFNSADDTAVRFYLTDDSINNCTEEILAVPNTAEEVETTLTLKAAQVATAIMFASASYDVKMQDVTLCSIIVSEVSSNESATVEDSGDWLSDWATTEEKCNLSGPTDSAMPLLALEGTTIRQIIRVTAAGSQIRFRLSNQYGESDVEVKSMHVAKQSKDALSDGKGYGTAKVHMSTIDTATDTAVTVNGQSFALRDLQF